MKIVILGLCLFLASCATVDVSDSTISSNLLGVVFDGKSRPIQSGKITILNSKNHTVLKVTTDIDGRFFIPELKFGSYRALITHERIVEKSVDFNHFDIESTLVIRVSSFNDLERELEVSLKNHELTYSRELIENLQKIDKTDIYIKYLESILFLKSGETKRALEVLYSIKSWKYKYIDELIEKIEEEVKDVN